MCKQLHLLVVQVSQNGLTLQACPNKELEVKQFIKVLNKLHSNKRNRQLSIEFHESLSLRR